MRWAIPWPYLLDCEPILSLIVFNKIPMRVPFLDVKTLTLQSREVFLQAISRVVEDASFINGPYVERFEKNFASWVGTGFVCAGCANGTDAITIAATSLDLPPGSEAILPAMTFFGTAEGIARAGLEIRLVDVSPDTWLLDPKKLEEAMSPRTKLIVPVHLYGQMAPMDVIGQFADAHRCRVLEDAAQAHGARWLNEPVGRWADLATYSFYPGKNLGAFGDAGAILSRNEALISRCKTLRNHGGKAKYEHAELGWNSRLDAIQAAVLDTKLHLIDQWNAARRKIASRYRVGLSHLSKIELPVEAQGAHHTYHLYVVLVPDRKDLAAHLYARGIETNVHYPQTLSQLQAFSSSGFAKRSFPQAERVAARCLSLPMCPMMTPEQQDLVIDEIIAYFN